MTASTNAETASAVIETKGARDLTAAAPSLGLSAAAPAAAAAAGSLGLGAGASSEDVASGML
jgi:hypothetical protein